MRMKLELDATIAGRNAIPVTHHETSISHGTVACTEIDGASCVLHFDAAVASFNFRITYIG